MSLTTMTANVRLMAVAVTGTRARGTPRKPARGTAFLLRLWGFGLCALGGLAGAAPSSNPYQGITERNVFGLRPPPAEVAPELPKPPALKLTLTGITTILGDKRALLKAPASAGPGQPPTEQYYMLREGQRDGDLEVLAIDEKAGTVRVNNAGTLATLNFNDNGPKLAPASALSVNGAGPAPANPFAAPALGGEPFAGGEVAATPLAVADTVPQLEPVVRGAHLTAEQRAMIEASRAQNPEASNPQSLSAAASGTDSGASLVPTRNSAGNLTPGTWRRSIRPRLANNP